MSNSVADNRSVDSVQLIQLMKMGKGIRCGCGWLLSIAVA